MKVLNDNSGMLTDFEVLDFLRARGATSDPMACLGAVANSECKVYDYLVHRAACNQTREAIEDFKKRCEEFMKEHKKCNLTKSEMLNIINLRPTRGVEIYPIISNMDNRFTEDENVNETEDFLNIVCHVLPPPPGKALVATPGQQKSPQAQAMEQS